MLPFPIISNTNEIPKTSIVSWDLGYNTIGLVTDSGDLFFSGANGYGQFGDGTTNATGTGVWIKSTMTGVQSVFMCKGLCTVIVKKDGTVWFAGRIFSTTRNLFGMSTTDSLAAGTYTTWQNITSGVTASTPSNLIKQIFIGYQYTALVDINGLLYFCGLNSSGQHGDGTTTNKTAFTVNAQSQTIPVQKIVLNPQNLNSNYEASVILTQSGAVYAAGHNYYLKCFTNFNYRSSTYSTWQLVVNPSGFTVTDIDASEMWYSHLRSTGVGYVTGFAGLTGSNASMNTSINTATASTTNGPSIFCPMGIDNYAVLQQITLSTGAIWLRGEGNTNMTPVLNGNTAVTSFTNEKNITSFGMPDEMKGSQSKEVVMLYNQGGVVKIYALNYLVGGQNNISNATFIQMPNPPFN